MSRSGVQLDSVILIEHFTGIRTDTEYRRKVEWVAHFWPITGGEVLTGLDLSVWRVAKTFPRRVSDSGSSNSVQATKADNGLSMRRIELICTRCDTHLGQAFEVGRRPTGLPYCMNSPSLKFVKSR